jgi:hypothetical protein
VKAVSVGPGGLALLLLLALLAAPVEYIAHEGGHYLAARMVGAQATLHFDRVTLAPGVHLGELQQALFAAAGPAVDWVVGLTALALLLVRFTPLRLVLAIWVARPLQFAPTLAGIDLPAFGLGGDLGSTDDAGVAAAIGLPTQEILGLELAVAIPLLVLIILQVPTPGRLSRLALLSVGVLVGWAGWLSVGPHLLP